MQEDNYPETEELIKGTQFDDLDDNSKQPSYQKMGKHFRLIKKLDSGSFGEIYQGKNLETNLEVAVKVEQIQNKTPMLFYEAKVYQYILKEKELSLAEKLWLERQPKVEKGFPEVYYCSNEGDYNVMIMEMLGPNLEDLFQICSRKFSAKTVCMIGLQVLKRIEFLHSKYMVHRDIKPSNFCIGLQEKKHLIYMIDLAFCKKWANKDGSHIPQTDGKQLTGTLLFSSVNNHKGIEHSRRDDIESFAYMLFYFLKGSLPWQNIKYQTKKEKIDKTIEKKVQNPENSLFKNVKEQQFKDILIYAQNLEFSAQPDYEFLRSKLQEVMDELGVEDDKVYTWNTVAQSKESQIQVVLQQNNVQNHQQQQQALSQPSQQQINLQQSPKRKQK